MKKQNIHGFLTGILTMALIFGLASPSGAALASKAIEVLTGITIYVNGVEMKPADANGNPVETFVYNGTTYIPLRAVSQSLGYNVQYDGSTKSVYIGDDPRMTNYLVNVCPPYEKSRYDTPSSFTMSGQTYTNGFTMKDNSYALFNLNGKYQSLEFDLGHIDGTSMSDETVTIYLDGTVSKVIEVKAEELPKHYTIPLNGALQMKIEMPDVSGAPAYGFADAILN